MGEREKPVEYIETIQVSNGVECDVYRFIEDNSRDLAVVRVARGMKTPLQKVLKGEKTIEGFLKGSSKLVVDTGKETRVYEFPEEDIKEVVIEVGQTMQWQAAPDSDLMFYEICEPPYEDGRYQNMSEESA